MNDESVLEDPQQRRLKDFGFMAGETVYPLMLQPNLPKEFGAALSGSYYDEPVAVRVVVHADLAFNVVPSLIRAVYEPYKFAKSDNPLGCWRRPNLNIEGWLLKSGFDPYGEIIRVHLYLDYISADSGDGYIQRIPDDPDPNGYIAVFS